METNNAGTDPPPIAAATATTPKANVTATTSEPPPNDNSSPAASTSASDSSATSSSSCQWKTLLNVSPPVNPTPPKKVKKNPLEMQAANAQAASLKLQMRADWDPKRFGSTVKPNGVAMSRIKKDLQEFQKHPPEGIFILVRDENISQLDALIVGPQGTPYQGGFFHFYLSFTDKYPFQPPRVRFMTTGNAKVRFNPNFYSNGKVCLSILGTWSGPQWNASQTLTSVLCSIQSLMSEDPYRNEPGYEKMKADESQALDYCYIIRHETLRVAVCDTLEGKTTCPKLLVERVVKPEILKNYQSYSDAASKAEERQPVCMFGENRGPFSMSELQQRISSLRGKLTESVDTTKDAKDCHIIGLVTSSETVDAPEEKNRATSSSKRTSWMEYESHSPPEDEWDDIFHADDDEEGEDDVSDLSDYQDDNFGADDGENVEDGSEDTREEKEKRQDNNNEGEKSGDMGKGVSKSSAVAAGHEDAGKTERVTAKKRPPVDQGDGDSKDEGVASD